MLAVLVTIPAAIPAALRASSGNAPLWGCYLAAFAGGVSMLVPAVVCLRAARPLPRAALGFFGAVAVSLGPLAILATMLKEKTHHRPLGGATFAMVAVGVLVAATLVMSRLLAWARSDSRTERRIGQVSFVTLLALALLLASALIVPSLPEAGPIVRGGLFDGLLLTLLGALICFARIEMSVQVCRVAGRVAVAVCALALILGSWAFSSEPVRQAMVDQAPAILGFLWLLS
jgi:hypothetical protein